MSKAFKRVLAVCLSVMFILITLPTTVAYGDQSEREFFDTFLEEAKSFGLVPHSMFNRLNEISTIGDAFELIFRFVNVKTGIDVDAIKAKHHAAGFSDEKVLVETYNELLGFRYWTLDYEGELSENITQGSMMKSVALICCKYIAPFNALMIYNEDPSLFSNRYNFSSDYGSQVVQNYLGELYAGKLGSSEGLRTLKTYNENDNVKLEVLVSYLYVFSMMSVPKDQSGKYMGGLSGDAATDKFVEAILDKAVKPNMDDKQKIKAIYDYMIYNFKHDNNMIPMFMNYNNRTTNLLSDAVVFADPILTDGAGTCDAFANMLRLLAIRLGFESNFVSGYYINKDGSTYGHGWTQIKVNDEWFWFDVDVEGSDFNRNNRKEPLYFLFMKRDSEWVTNHEWERSSWPAADGIKHPTIKTGNYNNAIEYIKKCSTDPAFALTPTPTTTLTATPTAASASTLTATPTASKVFINNKEVSFDAYNINGNNYFKLRDLAFSVKGTDKQFDVSWDSGESLINFLSNKAYTVTNGEMAKGDGTKKAPILNKNKIMLEGKELELTAYTMNGNNYFKLRDIGKVFNIATDWDSATSAIMIDTSKPYTE